MTRDSFKESVSNDRRYKFNILMIFIHRYCNCPTFKTFLIPNRCLETFGKVRTPLPGSNHEDTREVPEAGPEDQDPDLQRASPPTAAGRDRVETG